MTDRYALNSSHHSSDHLSQVRSAAVQSARRAVLDAGPTADLSTIEPWLARSWQRCMSRGAQPNEPVVFNSVRKSQLDEVTERNHAFVAAAQNSITRLAQMVSGLAYFALLTDAQGIVIHVDGAIDRADSATSLARVGVDLSEAAIGTSAICAALTEKHAVWLHQGEHFYDATSVFSCAGAPIFGARGELLGMIDLTGVRSREQRQLKHLVSQVATQIEHSILFRGAQNQVILALSWPLDESYGGDRLGSGDSLGFLRIDRDGFITGASAAARSMFVELEGLECKAIMLNDLFASKESSVLQAFGQQTWQRRLPLWSGLEVLVKRVHEPQSAQWVGDSAKQNASLLPIRQIESALILKAVNETRGNVNEAARRLGLSRATVYRKLATHKTRPSG